MTYINILGNTLPKVVMGKSSVDRAELLQGTLDLLVLRTLARGERHGYAIAEWIHVASAEALSIEEGALYPALHRLEVRGLLKAKWRVSEHNRRAKYLPPDGTGPASAEGGHGVVATHERSHRTGARSHVMGEPS